MIKFKKLQRKILLSRELQTLQYSKMRHVIGKTQQISGEN